MATEETPIPTTTRVEIPVRMLHVSALCAKEAGRYMMEAVLIESRPDNVVALIATDGRRLIVAETSKGLFDGDGSIIIPRDIAKSAAKLAKTKTESGDDEPMAEISQTGEVCTVTVFGGEGNVVFNWDAINAQFPPYREIIPDWSTSGGIATIGVTPELVAGSLKTLEKISGMDVVRVFLPPTDNAPIGFEAFDADLGITTLALVMPKAVDGWKVQKIKGEKKPKTDPAQAEFDPQTGEVSQPPDAQDPLYPKAVECARERGECSTAMLQRHFNIGYGRASAIHSAMCDAGLLGECKPNSSLRPWKPQGSKDAAAVMTGEVKE